jgi:hypothetical protein
LVALDPSRIAARAEQRRNDDNATAQQLSSQTVSYQTSKYISNLCGCGAYLRRLTGLLA